MKKQYLVLVIAALASGVASADTTVTVASLTGTLVSSLTTALGDIVTGVAPLIALSFGIAASVKWARRSMK
ncbi:hypothetical protein VVD49_13455 [Uliginosibacterium sp. H3]|uniref:Uncharacterized protein n=1 Tax=Uliginosibacterium silvisoli TaxID=3114758 RepID=A0ABU6K675_9RHOO|nr:hypothetical protein [Uliginosibacterium sp. H3]